MNTNHEDIGYSFEDDPKEKKTLKLHLNVSNRRAWMMVLSSFLEHLLSMGFQMTPRDLSVEWLEEFYHSHGLTAWVSSLSTDITLIVDMFTCDLL